MTRIESSAKQPLRFTLAKPTARASIFLLLMLLLGGILLAPIWTVRYPPLIDYPNHLARAFVLAHLKGPAFRFQQFYAADWNFYPYLTMDVILVGLQRFVPIGLAGRIFLSLCVLAVPPAAWFFIRQANPGHDNLALWSLLICNNIYFFLYGFLNLQLSLGICFLALGLWLRYLARPRMVLWCLLLLVITALYFTHLLGFGVAGLVVTAYALLARRQIREILLSWLLFLPGALFYLHSMVSVRSSWPLVFRSAEGKAFGLLAVMLGYSPPLDLLTLLALGCCFFGAWWRNPDFRWNYRWLGVAGALFALYWVFPAAYGAGLNSDKRLLPFLFLLTLAVAKVGPRGRLLAPVAVLLFVVRTANVEGNFVSMQPHLTGLARSFSVISDNARVLPIVECKRGSPLPEDHFWAYGVIRRGWFSPYMFHDRGVQPFRIRLQAYTPPGFTFIYLKSPDWARVREDYDYVWAYNVPQFSPPLAAIGQLVFEDGDLRVFWLNRSTAHR